MTNMTRPHLRRVLAVAATAVVGTALPALAAGAAPVGRPAPTFSGGGCLLAGKPGVVQVALFDDERRGQPVRVLPELGPADAQGRWSVAGTLPADLPDGRYLALPACIDPVLIDPAHPGRIAADPAHPEQVKLLSDHSRVFSYQRSTTTTTSTTGAADPSEGATSTTTSTAPRPGKPAPPHAVKVRPRFTG
jgi:hypothetical protein